MDFFQLLNNAQKKDREGGGGKDTPKPHSLYENIRRGTQIKIIRVKNSILNVYKGYIGEIRDYRRGQDYAMVTLNAVNNSTPIKVPLEHFEILEY
jgi:hypothetical protein